MLRFTTATALLAACLLFGLTLGATDLFAQDVGSTRPGRFDSIRAPKTPARSAAP